MRVPDALVALGVAVGGAVPAHGQAAGDAGAGVAGVQFENDAFGFGDDHYTQGIRLAYVPREFDLPLGTGIRAAAGGG